VPPQAADYEVRWSRHPTRTRAPMPCASCDTFLGRLWEVVPHAESASLNTFHDRRHAW